MNQFFSYFHNLINTTLLLYKISNSLTSKTDIQKKKNHIQLFIQVVFFCLILLSSKKKKKNNQLILSPSGLGGNIKPGLFSKHCELNKFNKQNSFKVEETLTPKLFETKESSFAPQPKLQKSQSASRLALPKESKQYRVERQELDNIPNIKHNQMNELSSKLYRELIEFNEQADFGGQNEIQQWSDDMIKKLLIIKIVQNVLFI
ncbi:unnamed protein product [Paramecium primaurelia]|uniref:Transmembrane protein n=1 Tax=Paramecium primaurelia TaxID=5886 RepID=A0A8S1K6Z5_PARPR|nr:unnamed protein product [Paramecium primaurelia]